MAATALLLAAPAASAAARHATVTVEHVSAKPCCGSGVLAFFVDLGVRTDEGKHLILSLYYLSPEQRFPRAGDVCRVSYKPDKSELKADGEPRLIVEELACKKSDGSPEELKL